MKNWNLPRANEYSKWYTHNGIEHRVVEAILPSQGDTPNNQGYIIEKKRGFQNWYEPEQGTFATPKEAFSRMKEICPEWDLPQLN